MQTKKLNKDTESLFLVVLTIVIAFVMLISYIVALTKFAAEPNITEEVDVSSEQELSSEPVSEEPVYEVSVPKDEYEFYDDFRFENIEVKNSDVTSGSLAIIKSKSASPVVAESDLVRIGTEKEGAYGLKDYNLKIRSDVMPHLDSFLIAFAQEVPENNVSIGEAYLAKNANTTENDPMIDLSTGYSVQFAIYSSSDNFTDAKYAFLYEQASKFGFIQRCPANKTSSTGFEADFKIYRYVGIAHSAYMRHYNYSLEEYIDKLKTEKVIERKAETGTNNAYVMYYVPKSSDSATTAVPVPIGCEYEISGDGSDGFIITVAVQA